MICWEPAEDPALRGRWRRRTLGRSCSLSRSWVGKLPKGAREEGKLQQAWGRSRGLRVLLFWREAAPWFDPLGPAQGELGQEGQGKATQTAVPVGKVNPVPLATCPASLHTAFLHSVGGEGTRGTLTLLPERSADGDKLTHPHSLWLTGTPSVSEGGGPPPSLLPLCPQPYPIRL